MNDVFYLTKEGKQKLETELAELKGPERTKLALRLKHAIEMGDLSENADYKAAKEDQGFLEGRIQEIEMILKNSQVVDRDDHIPGQVNIGSKVTVQEDNYPEEVFHLVGGKEADPRIGKISYESPMGSALLNHKVGETVDVITPNGILHLKILKIE